MDEDGSLYDWEMLRIRQAKQIMRATIRKSLTEVHQDAVKEQCLLHLAQWKGTG